MTNLSFSLSLWKEGRKENRMFKIYRFSNNYTFCKYVCMGRVGLEGEFCLGFCCFLSLLFYSMEIPLIADSIDQKNSATHKRM